jgi:hypothetical protein
LYAAGGYSVFFDIGSLEGGAGVIEGTKVNGEREMENGKRKMES